MRADRLTCGNTCSTDNQIWTQSDMTLYGELVAWRDGVAKKEGIMPTMVCPLDLLVLMAYNRPGCRIGLKRLSYYIPELLREGSEPDYLDDAFSIIFLASESGVGNGMSGVAEEDLKFYADMTFAISKGEMSKGMKGTRTLIEPKKSSSLSPQKSSILKYLKWTTIAAAAVTFWIGVLNKRRR